MSFGIANFDSLPPNVKLAFEDLEAWVTTFLLREHSPDGTHGWKPGSDPNKPNPFEEEGHWWKKGPWIFDDPTADSKDVIALRPPDLSAGTYHNYGPQGIDSAVIVEQALTGNVTLTGLQARSGYHKRRLLFRNNDASFSITLKHANTGSLVPNRFSLPDSKDLVLAAQQNAEMFYSQDRKAWTLAVTPHQSGGLETMVVERKATIPLTEAQLEALFTTPVEIVPAAGAGIIIVPVHCVVKVVLTTTYSTDPSVLVHFNGNVVTMLGSFTLALTSDTGTKFRTGAPAGWTTASTFDPRNKALMISMNANPGTPGTGVATATVEIAYWLTTNLN